MVSDRDPDPDTGPEKCTVVLILNTIVKVEIIAKSLKKSKRI